MEFHIDAFGQFDRKWALLCAGDRNSFNAMTISWGGLGTLWSMPAATVYVRHSRHTFGFMEKSEFFTVSFYPESMKPALSIMGSRSGRDCDKVSEAGLSPVFLGSGAITFSGAEKTLVCRKVFAQDLDINCFEDGFRGKFYKSQEEAHRMYIAQVTEII